MKKKEQPMEDVAKMGLEVDSKELLAATKKLNQFDLSANCAEHTH